MPTGDINSYLGGGIAAGLGAVGLWLANRLVGKAAVQSALNSGFKDLMTELQSDRDYWRELVTAEREQHAREINEIRVSHAKEIALLEGEILNLTQGYESLKNHIRRAGIPVPGSNVEPRLPTILD